MYSNSFGEFIIRSLILVLISIFISVIYAIRLHIQCHFKTANYWSVIQRWHDFLTLLSAIWIWGLFRIYIGIPVFVISIFFWWKFFFMDGQRMTELLNYEEKGKPIPRIEKPQQWRAAFFKPEKIHDRCSGGRYCIDPCLKSTGILIMYLILGLAETSTHISVYMVEFFFVATIAYSFIGRLIYHVAMNSPTSITYLCPGLSYLPVFVVGVVYYLVAVFIFLSICRG